MTPGALTSRLVAVLASVALIIGAATASAQTSRGLTELWSDTDFGFNGSMLEVSGSGDVYVLGDSAATNVVNLRKYSPSGVLLWQATYDDPTYNLSAVWLAVDGRGDAVALANIVRSTDGQPLGWMTLKYDANGTRLWVNAFPRAASSAARVIVDMAGNIYVAGTSVVTKYAPSGATLWQDDSGAAGQPSSMALSIDGARLAVAGNAGITGQQFRAVMYDTGGIRLWTYTDASRYSASDVAFRSNFDYETYYATGTYAPLDPNPYQMAIVKLDAAGNVGWQRSYAVGDRTYRVAAVSDGIVATGVDSSGYLDWMTIKVDLAGNLVWSRRFDATRSNDETPYMLSADATGVYVTGKGGPTPSSGSLSDLKGVVAKYSAAGAPQWAVWDPLAGGLAVRVPQLDFRPSAVITLGWGYLTTTYYTPTGLTDTAPSTPANLTGVATTADVTLSFDDTANNEFWVDVERCTGAGCATFTKIGQTIGENATTFRDTSVAGGTTYGYRVRAAGFMGASVYSNTVAVTIPGGGTAPPAPSNLSAQAVSRGQINLSWTNNSASQTGVRVERCRGASCTNFALVATLAGSAGAYASTGLAGGTTYRYRVSAFNSAGASPYSNIATATTPKK